MDDRFVDSAEPLDGPSVTRLARASAELGVSVVVGLNEPAGDGRIHNTLVALQDGAIAAVYRKVHLYDAFGYKESDRVLAADPSTPQLLELNGFRIGMQTCYDLRFPELFRPAARDGAELLLVIASWPTRRSEHWIRLLQARAIENQAYAIGINRCGKDPYTEYDGRSVGFDPQGHTLFEADDQEQVIIQEIDSRLVQTWREQFPALQDMRW